MKPNGYTYRYKNPKPCDQCEAVKKNGGFGCKYILFEANGEKVCRECAKFARLI